jgi:hypothetical protein
VILSYKLNYEFHLWRPESFTSILLQFILKGRGGGGKGGGVFPPLCQLSISECSAHFLQYFHLLLKAVKGERASVLKFTIFVREKWSGDRLD